MPLKNNNTTILQQVNSYFSQSSYLKKIHESIDYSASKNTGTNIRYLQDFYLYPINKINNIKELNEFFDKIKSGIDLSEFEIKSEEDRFRIINEVKLGFGRIWYEEVVAKDIVQSNVTREFYDSSIIPPEAIFIEGKKNTIKLPGEEENNPFKNYDIKRRVRLFLYPGEDLARNSLQGKLSPASFTDLKYLDGKESGENQFTYSI